MTATADLNALISEITLCALEDETALDDIPNPWGFPLETVIAVMLSLYHDGLLLVSKGRFADYETQVLWDAAEAKAALSTPSHYEVPDHVSDHVTTRYFFIHSRYRDHILRNPALFGVPPDPQRPA